ncbi:MAG: hypothetical protein ACRDTG_20985 [Pseudonocardiaceae bacterium]
MELTKIAGDYDDDDCEAVYRTRCGAITVRGTLMTDVNCPDGEAMVEISVELLVSAARAVI